MARALSVTERTVLRHISDLLRRLDADTRFQAGCRPGCRPSVAGGSDDAVCCSPSTEGAARWSGTIQDVTWLLWVVGAVVLVAAGVVVVYVPRRRGQDLDRRVAWSSARAALDAAAVSRDAAAHPVPEADELFTRAELLAARRGGAAAAAQVADCATRADRLWRAAARG